MNISHLVVTYVFLYVSVAESKQKKHKNSRFRWKLPDYVMPWVKGPNVCAMEEVMGSRKRYFSECLTYRNRKICGKNTFIRYHCCTGFEVDENSDGCQAVAPVENLMSTVKHLYLKDFRKHAHKVDALQDRLEHGGAYTVFAPENKAFNDLARQTRNKLNKKKPEDNLLSYHMVNGRHYSQDLANDMELPTLYKNNATLKINKYSNGITTVNCARVILPNQPATNGIVHIIEDVIHPMESSATSVVESALLDDDLGEFVTALVLTDLANDLRSSARKYTIFAPSDEAFRNADPDLISRVLNDNKLVNKLLRYHILEQDLCASAITGPVSISTLEGQKLNLSCSVLDKLTVNDVPLSKKDHIAANGVIHTIDRLMIPDSVKTLNEKIKELNLYKFEEYAQQAKAYRNLLTQTKANYTILAPSQEAFGNLTNEQRRILQMSDQAVERVLSYHVIPGHVTTKDMIGDSTITTYSSSATGANTLNAYPNTKVYTKEFGINGARIVSGDHKVSNGVIHIIDQVLWPPEGVLMDRIQEDPNLKTFMSLLQMVRLDGELMEAGHQYTVFAPTNDAFEAMSTSVLENLMLNTHELDKFLKNHIIKSPTYLRTLADKWKYRFRSLEGDWLEIKRASHSEPELINDEIKVIEKDIMATNGVLHKVDTAFSCSCLDHFKH